MLLKILADNIVMEPVEVGGRKGYKLRGQLVFGRLLPGEIALIIEPPDLVAPTGPERIYRIQVRDLIAR